MLWFACRDPRTPLWLKLLACALMVYVFSPFDLIPDFIPVIGLIDDAVIVPLGVMLLLRLLPEDVRLASQERVRRRRASGKMLISRISVSLILLVWAGGIIYLIRQYVA